MVGPPGRNVSQVARCVQWVEEGGWGWRRGGLGRYVQGPYTIETMHSYMLPM